tara:strand:+ start:1613 stop:2017 length:405 start_codon:yes stop_codon:yes gene_type:complete
MNPEIRENITPLEVDNRILFCMLCGYKLDSHSIEGRESWNSTAWEDTFLENLEPGDGRNQIWFKCPNHACSVIYFTKSDSGVGPGWYPQEWKYIDLTIKRKECDFRIWEGLLETFRRGFNRDLVKLFHPSGLRK